MCKWNKLRCIKVSKTFEYVLSLQGAGRKFSLSHVEFPPPYHGTKVSRHHQSLGKTPQVTDPLLMLVNAEMFPLFLLTLALFPRLTKDMEMLPRQTTASVGGHAAHPIHPQVLAASQWGWCSLFFCLLWNTHHLKTRHEAFAPNPGDLLASSSVCLPPCKTGLRPGGQKTPNSWLHAKKTKKEKTEFPCI